MDERNFRIISGWGLILTAPLSTSTASSCSSWTTRAGLPRRLPVYSGTSAKCSIPQKPSCLRNDNHFFLSSIRERVPDFQEHDHLSSPLNACLCDFLRWLYLSSQKWIMKKTISANASPATRAYSIGLVRSKS